MQVSIDTPADDAWNRPALSPDGTRIAFTARTGIVIRAIDSLEGQVIALPCCSDSRVSESRMCAGSSQ
jgi:hypothetical protein